MPEPMQHPDNVLAQMIAKYREASPRELVISAILPDQVPIVDETGREVGFGTVVNGRIVATVTDGALAAQLRRVHPEISISIGYRIEVKAIPALATSPAEIAADDPIDAATASDAERERVASIRDIARRAKLGEAWANKLIDAGTTVRAARYTFSCMPADASATDR